MIIRVNQYIEAWNSFDEKIRLEKLQASFSSDGNYIDPHVESEIKSLVEMNSLIKKFREKFDHELILTNPINLHHSVFRFQWKLENKNSILSKGIFIGEFNESKLIKRIIGFLD